MTLNVENQELIEQLKALKEENLKLQEELKKYGILKNAFKAPSPVYKFLLDSSNEIIYTISLDGVITSANLGVENVSGWKPEELVGKHYTELVHPEQAQAADLLHAAIANSERPAFFELLCRRKDGQYLKVEFSIAPIFDAGNVVGTLGIGRDITARKRIEDDLKQSEERYRILFETATDIIYTVAPDGLVTTVNPYVKLSCGWEIEDIIGKPFTNFMHPDELQYAMQLHQYIAMGKKPPIFELRFLHKDGHYLNAEFSITPFFKDGQFLGTLGIGRDVTERNRIQELIKKSEQQQKAILNNITDIAWLKDFDGHYIMVNEAFEKAFGVKNEHLTGKTSLEIFMAEEAMHHVEDHEQVVKTGNSIVKEERFEFYDRSRRIFEVSIVPIYNHKSEIIGTTGIAHDITERKKVEEQLVSALQKEKELNLMKATFLETVSHEFRTPLSVILLSSEMMEQYSEKMTFEKKETHVKKIRESVNKMTALLDDVLMLTKNEAKKMVFKPAPVNLRNLCESIYSDISLINKNGCVINFNYADELKKSETILADESLLRYIITNLLNNAAKYSPVDGRVNFEVNSSEDGKLVILIKDNGIGIPEEDMPILFETFHRARNVGGIKGTGIGLSIVKRCVELHGGSIKVNSKVNSGSEFIVKIPLFTND
ncbi:MAG: PAS domain-containing sensor histidine kinase [Candidatus Wallbacteria bacterium]